MGEETGGVSNRDFGPIEVIGDEMIFVACDTHFVNYTSSFFCHVFWLYY